MARSAWFDRGVKALRCTIKNLPELYACPLCVRGFRREALNRGILTREDVPPKRFGGRKLVLTCRACNSSAGHQVDAELNKLLNLRDFLGGHLAGPRKFRLTMGGKSVNTLVRRDSGGMLISDLGRLNQPVHQDEFKAELDRKVDQKQTDWTMTLSTLEDSYKGGWPEISLLRAAYLAAFAKFGYRYVFRKLLEPVRKQIVEPERKSLRSFLTTIPEAKDAVRLIGIVTKPEEYRSVLVQVGQFRVFLPLFDEDGDFYDRLERAQEQRLRIRLTATFFGWPDRPEHLLDFEPSALRALWLA